MSLRFLYRKVPVTQRTCSYYRCQKPILRNIARDQNGKLYHYGCLGSARDEKYRCLECYSMFDATEAGFQTRQRIQGDSVGETIHLACPNCGCINLKPLNARNPS